MFLEGYELGNKSKMLFVKKSAGIVIKTRLPTSPLDNYDTPRVLKVGKVSISHRPGLWKQIARPDSN